MALTKTKIPQKPIDFGEKFVRSHKGFEEIKNPDTALDALSEVFNLKPEEHKDGVILKNHRFLFELKSTNDAFYEFLPVNGRFEFAIQSGEKVKVPLFQRKIKESALYSFLHWRSPDGAYFGTSILGLCFEIKNAEGEVLYEVRFNITFDTDFFLVRSKAQINKMVECNVAE